MGGVMDQQKLFHDFERELSAMCEVNTAWGSLMYHILSVACRRGLNRRGSCVCLLIYTYYLLDL